MTDVIVSIRRTAEEPWLIAAVRLAQGVGRLIRSSDHKGVVAVLDSRPETARGYGAAPTRSGRMSLPKAQP